MGHRIGVCQSCRSRFQIPASFAPNRAKCRSCGGVVSIGPAEGAPAPVRVATPDAPHRAPEPVVEARAPAPAPTPVPRPATPEKAPARASAPPPPRKSGLARVLLVAGIVVVIAIGLWSLLA